MTVTNDIKQDKALLKLIEKAMLLNLNENAYKSGLIDEQERNRIVLRIDQDYPEAQYIKHNIREVA